MKTWADLGIDTKGHLSGEIKTICPQCSHTRKKKRYPCLNVNLDKGVYHCWHCDWSGSLGKGDYVRPVLTKVYRKPDYVAEASGLPDKVVQWFASRGIPESVLRRNQIGHTTAYFPQVEEERSCVTFPYRRRGEVVNIKYRTGDKLFRMAGGCERILCGLDDVADRLIWVEGEMDKLSIEAAGFMSCVSVPDGAPAPDSKNYETKFDFLAAPEIQKAAKHLIAVDNDPPGLRLRDELVRRLGPDNCLLVDWPEGCKDANDTLTQCGADKVAECIAQARELPIIGAHGVEHYMDDILRLYRDGVDRGVSTGWPNVDEFYRIRAGDVTVLTGAPNSGKSEWLDALLVNLATREGWRFGVFSPEQGSPAEHIAKLVEKRSGKPFNEGPNPRVSASELDQVLTWVQSHFDWLEPEKPTLSHLLDVAKRLVLRRGVRGIVLDPWNEIEHARPHHMSETEYIGNCLREIRRFARGHQVHAWIVAHPRILQKDQKTGQYPVAGPYEISGSANWNNKPDAVISVWRERGQVFNPEVEIHIQKIRSKYVGQLGMARLHWNKVNGRYFDPFAAEQYEFKGEAQ